MHIKIGIRIRQDIVGLLILCCGVVEVVNRLIDSNSDSVQIEIWEDGQR